MWDATGFYPRPPLEPRTCEAGSGSWATPSASQQNWSHRQEWGSLPLHRQVKLTYKLPTGGTAHAAFPTPSGTSYGSSQNEGQVPYSRPSAGKPSLETMARRGLWPTPHGFSKDGKSNGPSGNELGRAVNQEMWPTPTASFAERWGLAQPQSNHDTEKGFREAFERHPAPDAAAEIEALSAENREEREKKNPDAAGWPLNPDWVELLMGWPRGWTSLEPLDPAEFREWLLGFAVGGSEICGPGPWGSTAWERGCPRVVPKAKDRVKRLKAIGNGQVPLCAAEALRRLSSC